MEENTDSIEASSLPSLSSLLFKTNTIILLILFIISVIFNTIIHRHNDLLIVPTFIIFTLFFSLIFTLFYYFKLSNRIGFMRILISNYISLTMALSVYTLLILFIGFVFVINIPFPNDFIYFTFLVITSLFTYIITYIYTFKFTINVLINNYEFEAFFKFRRFPFSLWNYLSSKDNNFNRSSIKLSLIISLLISIVFMISFSNATYETLNSGIIEDIQNSNFFIAGENYESFAPYWNILKTMGYENSVGLGVIDKIKFGLGEDSNYKLTALVKDGLIYYNCNIILENCESQKIIIGKTVTEQFDTSDYLYYVSGDKNNLTDIYLLKYRDIREIYTNEVFYTDPELANTAIAKDINIYYKEYLSYFDDSKKNIPEINSKLDSFNFYFINNLEGIDQVFIDSWVMLERLIYSSAILSTAYEVKLDSDLNKLYFKNFPYNTSSLNEYNEKLKENIFKLEEIESGLETIETDTSSCYGSYSSTIFNPIELYGKQSNFDKAFFNIFNSSNIAKKLNSIVIDGCLRYSGHIILTWEDEIIVNKIYPDEDLLSQAIRNKLKSWVVETKAVEKCQDDKCKLEVAKITEKAMICSDYMEEISDERDKCIIDYIKEDESDFYCTRINDKDLKEACENKFN